MRVRIQLDRLTELLARSGRSQNAWALRIGLSRGHWSDVVNGKHPYPSARTRAAMLDAFGVEFDELFVVEKGGRGEPVADFQSAISDRYLIDREIGEGGMGTVFLARDVRFGRSVALKVVSEEAVSDLGPERFLHEIRHSARLVHPNVLPVLDAGEAAGKAFLATPHVEGGSLRAHLDASGPLPLQEVLRITRGLAAALEHAHARGVLHTDVKPENVLLHGDHVYLTDFGLARALRLEAMREWERPPEIDIAAGTPAYVSPEQARGAAKLDGRADVYSLACVVFEMLAGRPPFTGTTTTEIVRRRFAALPPALTAVARTVPAEVARQIEMAMALDPGGRPSSPAVFAARLADAATLSASTRDRTLADTAMGAVGRWAVSRPSRPRGSLSMNLLQELRQTVRTLSYRPLFAIVAILTLALGIGANAAIFSVIDAVVLRPLPFPEVGSLVRIYSTYEGNVCCTVSVPNFLDLRERATRFELAAYYSNAVTVTGAGEAERLSSYSTTSGFFELLGHEPLIGRAFSPSDDFVGAEPVAVISERMWRDRYEADPGVLGESLAVNGEPRVVIGVAPEEAGLGGRPQLYLPFGWNPEELPARGSNFLSVLGRVAPGATIESAMAEIDSTYAELVALYPDDIRNRGVGHRTFDEWLVGSNRKNQLLVLWGAVGIVLLVACVNVMNLMLARAESRQRELAVRAALGAGRARLVWYFLSEAMLVSLIGGAVGVAVGYAGLGALLGIYGRAVPRAAEVTLSSSVLLFTLGMSLLTGLLVGLVPAWQTALRQSGHVLHEGGRGTAGGQSRLRRALIVVEVGAALVLVVGAGLMLKSFWQLSRVDLGVDAARLLTVRVSLPQGSYPALPEVSTFFTRLRDEVARLPGVESAGLNSNAPFTGAYINYSGVAPVGREDVTASFVESRVADPDYFETLQLDILAGRNFDGSENPDMPAVTVVNEELVRQLFADADPVGAQIAPGANSTPWTIIGVVENLREHGPDRRTPPTMYFASGQWMPSSMSLLVRTTDDPMAVVPAVRAVVADLDPDIPLYEVDRLDRLVDEGLGSRRFAMSLLATFAGIALALGAIGIYGVMAYTVERRTREIGLRQALGASRGSVIGMVLRQGTVLTLLGIVLGTVGAYLLRQTMGTLLFGVEGFDLPTYAVVAGVLAGVSVLACLVPARRAAAVDPMHALRDD